MSGYALAKILSLKYLQFYKKKKKIKNSYL